MREHFVIDPLISKRQQLLLATQLCRMVLKVRRRLLQHFPCFKQHQQFLLGFPISQIITFRMSPKKVKDRNNRPSLTSLSSRSPFSTGNTTQTPRTWCPRPCDSAPPQSYTSSLLIFPVYFLTSCIRTYSPISEWRRARAPSPLPPARIAPRGLRHSLRTNTLWRHVV
jgi:hypothetical protein